MNSDILVLCRIIPTDYVPEFLTNDNNQTTKWNLKIKFNKTQQRITIFIKYNTN